MNFRAGRSNAALLLCLGLGILAIGGLAFYRHVSRGRSVNPEAAQALAADAKPSKVGYSPGSHSIPSAISWQERLDLLRMLVSAGNRAQAVHLIRSLKKGNLEALDLLVRTLQNE